MPKREDFDEETNVSGLQDKSFPAGGLQAKYYYRISQFDHLRNLLKEAVALMPDTLALTPDIAKTGEWKNRATEWLSLVKPILGRDLSGKEFSVSTK